MKKNILTSLLLLIFMNSFSLADVPKSKKNNSNATVVAMTDTTFVFNYNNIHTYMSNNGMFIDYHNAPNTQAMIWPKASIDTAQPLMTMFQSALWVTALDSTLVDTETAVREELVGSLTDFTQDMRPGAWGTNATDLANRIYTVDIGMLADPSLYDDFQNWPTNQGAPWVDVDGDGIYSPLPAGLDHPKFYGDQVSWFATSDDDKAYKLNMGTEPTNLEFHTTAYAFDRPIKAPKYSDVIFYRIKMINKGTKTLEKTYVGIFADPDLGYAGDDFVGVDVDRSLGFAWNDGEDSQFAGSTVFTGETEKTPAVGVDFIQGPMVDCTSNAYVDITLKGTDSDGDALSYNVRGGPSNGTTTFISQNVVRYTPNSNFTGSDSFIYDAHDGQYSSNTATVSIYVSDGGGSNLPSITSPNGGETLQKGSTYAITWENGFGDTGIQLYRGTSQVSELIANIDTDSGSSGSWNWTVPSDLTSASDYRIRIFDAETGNNGYDYSDGYFTIAGPPTITSPNGGETWSQGSTYAITWDDGFNSTGIQLYRGTSKISELHGDVGSVSSWNWTVPSNLTPATDYKIRIYDAGPGENDDYSDDYFTIASSTSKSNDYQNRTVNLNQLILENQDMLVVAAKNIDYSSMRDANGFVRCGTDELEVELQLLSPEIIAERSKFFAQVEANREKIDFSNTFKVDIPVIFHVLYSSASENISAAQIGYNFDQLNLDFKNLNSDGSKIPQVANPSTASFDPNIDYSHYSVRGTHNVEFIGFNGETSGASLIEGTTIRRYQMSQSELTGGVAEARSLVDSITPDGGATGGYQEGYFNVYIAPLEGGLLGQASFTIPHTVVETGTVGSVDNPGTASPYNLGRTLTHEAGHNFLNYHTFQHNSCSDTPNVSDIPVQITSNGSSANLYSENDVWYGKGANNSCLGTTGKGDQFMNYMDYSADADLVMFSAEQAQTGYAWAYSYSWTTNTAPVVENMSINATINESCDGAQMFGEIHPGKKNLPIESFGFFINGDATYTDPATAQEARNYMKGLRKDGSAYPNHLAGDAYNQKFALYGDPNTAHSTANPLDGNYAASADRRFTMSMGPFTMAPNDSQEVVFAYIHDLASDALAAVDSLKQTDTELQNDYDDLFSIFKYTGSSSADLQTSTTSGYAPLSVSFDGSNSSPSDYYYWDFDNDGTTDSRSASPKYTFKTPGEYKVKLDIKYKNFVNGYSTLSVESDSVVVNVASPNPTVSNVSYTINEDTAETITLTGTDPQNQSLSFKIEENPANATISLSGATLIYTPNENFAGEDSLKYSANNGNYDSNIGKITIQVNAIDDDPTTFDITATTDEDTAVDINLSAEEYDGDAYSFAIKQSPSHGTLGTISGSVVTYTPNADWFGVDQFTYEATDDRFAKINIATAAITVNPINDAPTTNDMNIASYEDQATTITLDVNDIDGDNLSVTNTSPSNGTISAKAGNLFTYTPNEDYNGSDSFTYYANDGTLDSNTSTVSISLSPVNDASSDFTVLEEYLVNDFDGNQWTITTSNLIVTPENEQDSLQFIWNESTDIDGDQIQYRMIGYDDLEFLTMDEWTTSLSQSWSIQDLVSNTDTVNIAQGSWSVIATDGEFLKESNYGASVEFFINGIALIPDAFIISQNYPNPFNSSTTINYDIPESQHIAIRIYDIRGRLIKTLIDEHQNAGYKSITWDGTNEDNEKVSAGVYFYQIHTSSSLSGDSFTKSKKLLKLN